MKLPLSGYPGRGGFLTSILTSIWWVFTVVCGCFWNSKKKKKKEKTAKSALFSRVLAVFLNGTPKGTRTPDLLIRSQSLYPTELSAHSAQSA